METNDPFRPLAFGSRPSLGAYWPDTRFIELQTNSGYFERLLGRRPRSRDSTLLSLAGSVVHHERVHWQIAHSLSWGLQRSALISMKTTLASVFFKSLSPDELRRVLADQAAGQPPIRRTPIHDLALGPDWSGTHYTLAEHSWLFGVMTFLIDRGAHGLASLRPPEFMLGVTSQYLGRGFDPYVVAFADDGEFGERARTFKSWKRDEDETAVWSGRDLSVQSVEECLALIGQLNYIDAETAGARTTRRMVETFRADILSGVFGEAGHPYARCFEAAQAALGQSFDALDLSLLGLICELALDPPLPFDIEGCATAGDWSSFHPALRFKRLLDSAARLDWLRSTQLDQATGSEIAVVAEQLLFESKLQRATTASVEAWLGRYDEDTTEWPSQELAWQHVRTGLGGRRILDKYPGLLFDFDRCADHKGPTPFLDLPYVVIDGRTNVLERGSEPAYRDAGKQIFNAHVARATDHFAFGRGALNIVGLPTHEDDGFSIFTDRLHEFFSSAWPVEVPKLDVVRAAT